MFLDVKGFAYFATLSPAGALLDIRAWPLGVFLMTS